jgi:proline iminopeptidase
VSVVPESERHDVAGYYKRKLFGDDQTERKRFAKEWMVYESSILKLDYRPEKIESELKDFAAESLAYLEAHYILNNCFIEENFIIPIIDKRGSIATRRIKRRTITDEFKHRFSH